MTKPAFPASTVYQACIAPVSDAALRRRLSEVAADVQAVSNQYDLHGRSHPFCNYPRRPLRNVSTDEMVALYKQRLVAKRSPGRAYYDALKLSAETQGRCPFCAQRIVTTLDHYLPKSQYPELAVAPLNLVPCCGDCNKAKLEVVASNPEDALLHPYFDNIEDEVWLDGVVTELVPSAIVFEVKISPVWPTILGARVREHFRLLGLGALYASTAAEELCNIRHLLKNTHSLEGRAGVRKEMQFRAESAAVANPNGWRAATYRAWQDCDWFCDAGSDFT